MLRPLPVARWSCRYGVAWSRARPSARRPRPRGGGGAARCLERVALSAESQRTPEPATVRATSLPNLNVLPAARRFVQCSRHYVQELLSVGGDEIFSQRANLRVDFTPRRSCRAIFEIPHKLIRSQRTESLAHVAKLFLCRSCSPMGEMPRIQVAHQSRVSASPYLALKASEDRREEGFQERCTANVVHRLACPESNAQVVSSLTLNDDVLGLNQAVRLLDDAADHPLQ